MESKWDSFSVDKDEMESILMRYFVGHRIYFYKLEKYMVITDREAAKGKRQFFNDSKKQWTINYMSYFNALHGKFPKKEEIFSPAMKKAGDDEAERVAYAALLNAMYGEPIIEDSDFIEEAGLAKVKNYRCIDAMYAAKAQFDSDKYGSDIVGLFEKAIDVKIDRDLGISINDVRRVVEVLKDFNKPENIVTSGFTRLDETLGGGFRKKELYVIAAPPGIGKTAFLGTFALKALQAGKNVVVYTFETGAERLLFRYYSAILGLTKLSIDNKIDELEDLYLAARNDSWGELIVKEYNSNAASSADLATHLNELKMHTGFEPDLVVVDYIAIMRTNGNDISPDNSFKYYKTVAEELRNLAKTFKIPVLTASQINREGMAKDGGTLQVTTGKFVSESRGIYDTADYFATLNTDASEKSQHPNSKNTFINLYTDKNRNGPASVNFTVEVDYSIMSIVAVTTPGV